MKMKMAEMEIWRIEMQEEEQVSLLLDLVARSKGRDARRP